MPILENARHESFSQRVAAGASAANAYLAAGYKTSAAQQCGSRLLTNVQVRARVQELQSEIAAQFKDASIATVGKRVEALQIVSDKINALLAARAADPNNLVCPGGETGLLVRKLKVLGNGVGTVEEFAADVPLLRVYLDVQEQAARELGQRVVAPVVNVTVNLVERLNAGRLRVINDASRDVAAA